MTKILNDLLPIQREDAVKSLVYEAQMRLQDPVYGCVGIILMLEDQLQRIKFDLSCAWAELTRLELAAGVRRIGMEEVGFPDWLQEQQRMMMMMMMMRSEVNESGATETGNGSDSSIGEQRGMSGAGGGDDDEWHHRGTFRTESLNLENLNLYRMILIY